MGPARTKIGTLIYFSPFHHLTTKFGLYQGLTMSNRKAPAEALGSGDNSPDAKVEQVPPCPYCGLRHEGLCYTGRLPISYEFTPKREE